MKSILISLLLFSQMTTRLGWPGGEYGFGVALGFLLVCILILFGFMGILAGEDCCGHFIGGIVIWVIAGLLLQALPVRNGIQFIPLVPWSYTSWLAWIISCIVWLGLIAGSLMMFSNHQPDRTSAVGIFLAAMAINALLSFATPANVAVRNPPTQSDPIAQWERLRDERKDALNRLLSDKEALIGRIRGLGAKNKRELMANPVGRTLVEELEQLCQQIANTKNEVVVIETAAERAKSHRRSVERQTMPKLTADDYERMSAANHALDVEQTPGSEIHRDKLLDQLFQEEK